MITKAIIGILALSFIGAVVGLVIVYQNLQASQSSLGLTRAELEENRETLEKSEELNRGLAAANEGLIAKIQEQAVQIQQLEASNSDLVAESRRIYQEIQRVDELNTSLDQEIREVTANYNSLNEENRSLAARNSQVEAEKDRVEADNELLSHELEIAGENARTLQDQNYQQDLVIHALEQDKTKLASDVTELEGQNRLLGQQNAQQASAIQTLEQDKTKLTADVTDLRSQNQSLINLTETYQSKSGTVNQLNTKIDSLRAEIRRLEDQRKPLMVESFPASFKCTGSMEPKITCLDSATMLQNFRPQDISVGTAISFRPTVACKLTGSRVLHRVMKVKVERGIYYYWPKGDNNSGPDECWIPESNVYGYIIELHKNTEPQNSQLRNSVNAAKADMDRAWAAYQSRRSAYGCPDPNRTCTVSPGKYRELIRLRTVYLDAAAYHQCWVDSAKSAFSLRSGPPIYTQCVK